MFRMTRQRVIVVGTLARGPATFPVLMAALGIPEDYTRQDYARAHRIIVDLVQQGIIAHQKKARHHASTFALTPAGWALVAYYRREYQDRLEALGALAAPAVHPQSTHFALTIPPGKEPSSPIPTQPEIPLGITCPECGETLSLARAKQLLDQGAKVLCTCSNNLTLTARQILE